MTLKELNQKFEYVTDSTQYGRVEHWAELEEMNGKLYGDCESYAITLKKNVPEFKDWDYWYCKISSGGHCILRNGSKVIDNNCQSVMSWESYLNRYSPTKVSKYTKIGLWYRFTMTKWLGYVPVIG